MEDPKDIYWSPLTRKVNSDGSIIEPSTGFRFPVLLRSDVDVQDNAYRVLAGVGFRDKSLLRLKTIIVYAFGFYVKPENLRSVLGKKYAGVAPDVLKFRTEFYDDLLSHELDMTVRVVVNYKRLRMDMVRSAFNISLRNRLRKITGSDSDAGLGCFFDYLRDDLRMKKGTVIDFRWLPGGRLTTEVSGKELGTIVSPSLCRAFFDMYIGEPPVLQATKEEIGESFARILNCDRMGRPKQLCAQTKDHS
ncbi:hypothetical protein CBR_g20428 [Chara braunii]|uniref:Chalcone isomerase domain-containing protein n=1 Tax=Chara braunii TaxID=69332 RepID=A0A388JUF2_CHABU|nr:hypothetical protein CBR_g20428 [Chara braunii]|eukprot:GBG61397.1 hypothetical protein CBR_g20428 [Chara braunii]